jgi:hypothetical protein
MSAIDRLTMSRTDHEHAVACVSAGALGEGGQGLVDAHFQATASYWETVYEDATLSGLVYRHRRSLARAWIDRLGLGVGVPILEVGCGPSLMSTTLAPRPSQKLGETGRACAKP